MDLREKREANRCAIDEFNRVKRAKLDRELAKPLPIVADPKADKKRDRERANRASAAASRAKLIFYSKELERRTDRLEMERNAESERANRACKKLTALRDEVITLRKVLRELWDLKDQKVCAYLIDSDALFLLSRRREEEEEDGGEGEEGDVGPEGRRSPGSVGPRCALDRAEEEEGVTSADSEDGTKSEFLAGRLGQNDESLPRPLSPSSDLARPKPSPPPPQPPLPPPPPLPRQQPQPPSAPKQPVLLGIHAMAGQRQQHGQRQQTLHNQHLQQPHRPQSQQQTKQIHDVSTAAQPQLGAEAQHGHQVIGHSPRPSSTLHSLLHPPQETMWFEARGGGSMQQARAGRRCVEDAGMRSGSSGRTGRGEIGVDVGCVGGAKYRGADWWVMHGTRGTRGE